MISFHLRTKVSVSCLALVLFACSAEPGRRQGDLTPPTEPEEPLLELSHEGGLIANPDPTPLVRVYPGGRVLVHYPVYMKMAGDYSLQLEEEELDILLESFSNEGVLMLRDSDLQIMAQEMQLDVTELQIDDHGVKSVVRIRGGSFTPAGSTDPAMLNVDQTIRASGALLRGASGSSFESLKSLAVGIRGLEELARSESLERIK